MRTVVIDTNVLLSRPDVVTSFHDADVVIPEMVLSEIDKLKTARVDPELRYKGRQISRILFELSEVGSLHDGVEIAHGTLRVVGLSGESEIPTGLSWRNTDDRILGVAVKLRNEGCEDVTLVTNDLNMLLKAQTLQLNVEHVQTDDSFMRRFVVRPFQRYRIPLGILATALAVFAAVIYLTIFSPFAPGKQATGISALPPEFLSQLSVEQQQELNYLFRLQSSPKDVETLISLATLYDGLAQQNINYLPFAVKHWEEVVALAPSNFEARTQLASDHFREHQTDLAIQEVTAVLAQNPDNVNANMVLGMFYLNVTPKLYQKAAYRFARVVVLSRGKTDLAGIGQHAQSLLGQVKKDAAAAGIKITTSGGGL